MVRRLRSRRARFVHLRNMKFDQQDAVAGFVEGQPHFFGDEMAKATVNQPVGVETVPFHASKLQGAVVRARVFEGEIAET